MFYVLSIVSYLYLTFGTRAGKARREPPSPPFFLLHHEKLVMEQRELERHQPPSTALQGAEPPCLSPTQYAGDP
jgi:hypothetical protein